MTRRMMVAMFMVLALMSVVGAAGAQGLSCPNFSSDQVAAQAYFEAGGGTAENNYNNMDTDGNGIACDEPGAFENGGPSAGPDGGPSAGPEGCADFATQAEAQTYLDNSGGTDVLNLDADGNGIACDETDSVTADSGESESVVSGLPSTGSGVQSQTSAFAVQLVGGTSLLLVIVAMAIRRDTIRQA